MSTCARSRVPWKLVVSGSLMSWAMYREGKAVDWIGEDLEGVLAPWLRRIA